MQRKLPIKPPYIAVLCLLLAWLLNRWFPSLKVIEHPYNKIGTLIMILGFSTLFWSFYLFRKNKTPIIPGKKPTFIVLQGPYKVTRNPMYLSVTTVLLGASVYIGNILSFSAPLIFFLVMNRVFVPFEEKLLEDIFGKKYLDYKKKVRRWI